MELHQVRYFLALSRTLSFTRAAEQCNVSQPALTKAVQKLEHDLGGDLIFRERHLTQLTDLGKLVLPMLERTAAAAEAATRQAREFRTKAAAPLRIGLAPSIAADLVMEPLADVARHVPGLEIHLTERSPDQLIEELLEGEIHVAVIGGSPPAPDRIDALHLFEERYVILAPHGHPLTALQSVPVKSLLGLTWLERIGCDASAQLSGLCKEWGGALKVRHRSAHEPYLQQMVAAGFGILPSPDHAPRLPGLAGCPIEGDPLRRQVHLLTVAGRRYSPALDAFLKIARLRDWRSKARQRVTPFPTPRSVDIQPTVATALRA